MFFKINLLRRFKLKTEILFVERIDSYILESTCSINLNWKVNI